MIIAQRLHHLLVENKAGLPLSVRADTGLAPSRTTSCATTGHDEHEERGESWQLGYPARM